MDFFGRYGSASFSVTDTFINGGQGLRIFIVNSESWILKLEFLRFSHV